jgi:hypothetical protein
VTEFDGASHFLLVVRVNTVSGLAIESPQVSGQDLRPTGNGVRKALPKPFVARRRRR